MNFIAVSGDIRVSLVTFFSAYFKLVFFFLSSYGGWAGGL